MGLKKIGLLLIVLWMSCPLLQSQVKDNIRTVVIDAGHGGHDPGCLGTKSKEKDVALSVALKVGKLISDKHSDVKVIYTRSTDVFVELFRRAQIANNQHADLFISIHCNASESKTARGTETYVMGLHRTASNLEVAKKENSAILLEKNYENNYEGFDPTSPETNIIFSLYTAAYLKNSSLLASKVQNNLIAVNHFPDRKVQQAGYWVLYKVAMPSILIELGFLTTPEEEAFLIQPEKQDLMAQAIANAFTSYKNDLKNDKTQDNDSKPTPSIDTTSKQENPRVEKPRVEKPRVEKPVVKADSIVYRIQFCTSSTNLDISDKQFAGLKKVQKYKENNIWKYTTESSSSYNEILGLLPAVKKSYPDAFMVAFKNNEKISISEARRLQK